MGACKSILDKYEDPDSNEIIIKNKKYANEVKEFQRQLRFQKCYSELDITTGKPKLKINLSKINHAS